MLTSGFDLGFGHLFAGHEPDRIIGDAKFVNVSNEVLQFLSGDPDAKLTAKQMNELIDAIVKQCGNKGNQLKITRPPIPLGGISAGDSAGYPSFVPGEWYFNMFYIQEGTVTSTYELWTPWVDHLA